MTTNPRLPGHILILPASTVKVVADGRAPVSHGLDVTRTTANPRSTPQLALALLSVLRVHTALV